MTKRKKAALWTAAVVPVVLVGASAAYGTHYHDRALPGTRVAGVDVGGKTRAEIGNLLRDKAHGVAVTLSLPDGTKTVPLADLGTTVDTDATLERVFAPNGDWTAYVTAPIGSRSVDPAVKRDDKAYDVYVAALARPYGEQPKDATVTLPEGAATFVVTPGRSGTSLDLAGLPAAIARAARDLTSQSLRATVTQRDPAVTTQTAQALADKANDLVKRSVSVAGGGSSFVAEAVEKASWLTLPTDPASGGLEVDAERVSAWVEGIARSVDRKPVEGLRYLTSTGAPLRTVTEARDGVEVTNADALAAAITASLRGGRDATGTVDTRTVTATWVQRTLAPGAERLAYPAVAGEKWVDVNLSRHTMTAYVGGSVAFGPTQMVNGAPATPSDQGTFHIYLKNPLMTMRGQNADGSDYETEDVPWSSFYNGGEALHGAYWRSSFGYAASHGCINLPIPTAKRVYDWAPIGTPVAVHS